jgi:hypothetical protein
MNDAAAGPIGSIEEGPDCVHAPDPAFSAEAAPAA